ncbi:unnamed protein product [Ixodes hexagonus]
MPKMKKTKKHRSSTLPSMGRVSSSSITRMRIPGKDVRAYVGRNTLIVLIAERFMLPTSRTQKVSAHPATTMKKSRRFHASAR